MVPGTEAVNAFNQSWQGENNWLVPPPAVVPKCIRKMETDACKATLVIPQWTSAPYWSLLVRKTGVFKPFVKDYRFLPVSGTVIPGRGNNGIFCREQLNFRMLALRCDFKWTLVLSVFILYLTGLGIKEALKQKFTSGRL